MMPICEYGMGVNLESCIFILFQDNIEASPLVPRDRLSFP